MTNFPGSLMSSRLLPPETIWLEPEQIEQAKTRSGRPTLESQQWQSYLNALAALAFEQWLSDRLPEYAIEPAPSPIPAVCLEVNGFKFCLITVEHVLDETVRIPQEVVEQPELAAHFYVVLEVSEEQELVTLRGFLRCDELATYCSRPYAPIQEGFYQIPLSLADAEPNHLLFYCRTLQPAAIALPVNASAPVEDSLLVTLSTTTTKLTQWLQGAFDESWQAIDQLINPEAYLALGTRSVELATQRGKLINLGVQLGQQTVALLVNVTAENEGKLSVLMQLHPTGEARYLVPGLKLSLRSHSGKTLQEVVARGQDNYIQLKSFKGRPGTGFRIAIQLGSETVEENFEL